MSKPETEQYGFQLVEERTIGELNSTVRLYRHIQTGARLLSVINDDENKVFGISFATPPEDSTGLPHILEHSVLCGSRKYPVKEPFVELMKGSLNTFLNAFTFPDKTCYPVASQNLQDFYNLIDVYLDAVFYPRLTPDTLRQEGWHYELEELNAPLSFKGVVFNEMKGAYSSPDNLLGRYAQQSLFPHTPYGLDSGGDPKCIPDLTWEQFKRYHETYYHPSNAYIVFYGDDDPDVRLKILDEYLKDFAPLEHLPSIPLQAPFGETRRFEYGYDAGADASQNKSYFTLNWMLSEATDDETVLALHILSHILLGTPASPLRKALIDSGLGENLAGGGLEDELRQMMFSTGLKGIRAEDAQKVEEVILHTLEHLAEAGIERDTIEASLNTIEFALRENNTGGFPRGIVLMLRALTSWLHGGDPISRLAFETPLNAIKAKLAADPRYFEKLIRRYFLENAHRTGVLLKPDPEAGRRAAAEEQERLAAARAAMSEDELKRVMAEAEELKRRQETPDPPEALATIPMLKLSDLDRKNKIIPLSVSELAGARTLYHDLFTNGIVYLDIGFDLRALPQRLLPYVPLFGRALLEMGAGQEDFVKLSQRIGRKTGGIRSATLSSAIRDRDEATTWLFLRGKATVAHAQDLLDILRDVLLTAWLDNRDRFRQIVLEEKAGRESGLVPGGHTVVNRRLRARLNRADWVAEQMHGIDALFFVRDLVERIDQDWPSVQADLEEIRRLLLRRDTMICNITLDEAAYHQFEPKLSGLIEHLPTGRVEPATWGFSTATHPEALTIPAQVNFVGKGANLYRLGYRLHGSALVATRYLSTTWLWDRVRVQGGAYGGFCLFDHRSGVFSYLSYRDPNLLGTLANYDAAPEFLRSLELSEEELTKAIIGVIGDLDTYLLPDAKGYTSMLRWLAGDTDESRQHLRDEVLSTTATDFKTFAETLEAVQHEGTIVVMGAEKAVVEANEQMTQKFEVTRVM
ncbi:MAG: insulinase family protein [Anaerolineae bacterium]|nr:insulinase family protein [Thermoflexales bacterium]MDW8407282.1 insulinase family protein [Anaerolineae bacterium]